MMWRVRIISWGVGVLGFAQVGILLAQEQGNTSAQQALAQLKMLQQKMGGQQPGSQNSPANTSKQVDDVAAQQLPTRLASSPTSRASAEANEEKEADMSKAVAKAANQQIEELAFGNLAQQLFPLSPDEIIRIKQLYYSSELAQSTTPGTPPKPTATSQFVNLSPGSTPPVIRLSQGFVSSLVFLDSTGSPWPISAYDLGDPASFNIQWDKTSNTLMIQAIKLYNYGNLAVRLKGLNTPVMLTLIPGQKAVDYRVDLRVEGYGPNAKNMPLDRGLPPSASDILLHVLDGVPPEGSSRLVVSGGDARAWLFKEKIYLRTNLTILSPGWIESMTSADGMHAYQLQKAPVLLVSWHGKVMQLKIEGL